MEFSYEEGQVWKYKTRENEEGSLLVIVAVEPHEAWEQIVSICVVGLQIKNPRVESGVTEMIHHLPFMKEAIDSSVVECLGYADEMPPFEEGYNSWKTAFLEGEAGVFSIPVQEVVQGMESVINQ